MPRLTLYEAKMRYATEMVEQDRLHKEWMAKPPEGTPEYTAAKEAWERKRDANKNLMKSFAADPELRRHMWSCMVDFCGSQQPSWCCCENPHPAAPSQLSEAMRADICDLSRKVWAWIEKHGLIATDSGSGMGGWHIGIPGSYEDAAKLCDLAYQELSEYIDAGVLRVVFHNDWGGWKFKNFNAEDRKKFLQGN
jgi:hypothetical protein